MQAIISGDREVQALLSKISAASMNGLAKPAIKAGLRVTTKAMKAAVPAPEKDAKKAIGWRLNKSKRNGEVMGKAGAAVGMKQAQIKKQQASQFLGRTGRPGVGISARNVMWWIMGTVARFTGSKRVRSKFAAANGVTRMPTGGAMHSTGRMPPQMDPIRQGFRTSAGAAINAISTEATKSLLKLVRG